MINAEIMIIGAGAAGVNAAIAAASSGAKVLLCDKNCNDAAELKATVENNKNIEVWAPATAVGFYEDDVVTVLYNDSHYKVKPQRLVVTTGAMENFLAFGNNDLPGILGARTAGTMLNYYGVLPGKNVLIADSCCEADKLTASLEEAGAKVSKVCASSLVSAIGESAVTGAVVKGTEGEKNIECDAIIVDAGLTPIVDLIALTECNMKYVEELCGYVPETDANMETSRKGVFCAGYAAGIESEEASLLQGTIAGYSAAISLGYDKVRMIGFRKDAQDKLDSLRDCPAGARIRAGYEQFSIRQ